jgi:superfamily II DNA or RNA helicase
MGGGKMSGVVWVPKAEVDYKTVVSDLRIVGKSYKGSVYFDCWYIDGDMVGLPRYWAAKSGYVGSYSQVPTEWGNFTGEYRGNQGKKIDEIVKSLHEEKCTLFTAFPGWGKTVAGCAVAAKLGMRTLVIADQENLLDQWEASAKTFFGVDSCRIQGKLWEDTDCPLTTATIQTLAISQNKDRLLGKFGLTIFDEAHTFACPSFHSIMPYIDSHYRLGVSATFRRADKLEGVWEAHLGEVTVAAEREALDAVYQSPALELPLQAKDYSHKGEISHTKMLTAIATLPEYNDWLADVIELCHNKGRKILLVSHRVEQCKTLHNLLTSKGIAAKLYVASTTPADLEEGKELGIILSTYKKMEKGVDVPSLDTLILATPCSDPEQAVGRVIRKKAGKKQALVIDPAWDHPYLKALWRKRAAVYNTMGIKHEEV